MAPTEAKASTSGSFQRAAGAAPPFVLEKHAFHSVQLFRDLVVQQSGVD
jgi:hypothetical protein